MSRAALLSALVLATGLLGACPDPMRDQPKYEPYEENVFFADQRAMRPLLPGVVPREVRLAPAAVQTGNAPDGSPVTEIPIQLARADLERGRQRFEIFCAACHGLLADGESVVAQKMALRPAPSLLTSAMIERPPGHTYRVIARGFGLMPSYAPKLEVLDRWRVVAYLQALQASQRVPLKEAPPAVRDELEKERP